MSNLQLTWTYHCPTHQVFLHCCRSASIWSAGQKRSLLKKFEYIIKYMIFFLADFNLIPKLWRKNPFLWCIQNCIFECPANRTIILFPKSIVAAWRCTCHFCLSLTGTHLGVNIEVRVKSQSDLGKSDMCIVRPQLWILGTKLLFG